MIDVHAHLTDEQFCFDLEEVIARAKDANVEKIICSAYNFLSSQQAVEIARLHENIFATVGLHPENVADFDEKIFECAKVLAKEPKVVAIGEIGLDYHYVADNKEVQKDIFKKQLDWANKQNLPVVVHSRDAMGDTIEILQNLRPIKESLLHCFSGSVESAKTLSDLGFSFSFGGVVTFANAKNVAEVVRSLPMDKIMLETDCPYLAPSPFRGKRNEPKNVVYVADMIARIKNISFEEVVEKTTANARRMFGI